jgi:hypothetical protein
MNDPKGRGEFPCGSFLLIRKHGANLVLEDITFEIRQGERVGLIVATELANQLCCSSWLCDHSALSFALMCMLLRNILLDNFIYFAVYNGQMVRII